MGHVLWNIELTTRWTEYSEPDFLDLRDREHHVSFLADLCTPFEVAKSRKPSDKSKNDRVSDIAEIVNEGRRGGEYL